MNNLFTNIPSHRLLRPYFYNPSGLRKIRPPPSPGDWKIKAAGRIQVDAPLTVFFYFMVLEGAGKLEYNGKEYKLEKGSCVFINCHHLYSHTNRPQQPLDAEVVPFLRHRCTVSTTSTVTSGRPVFQPSDTAPFTSKLDSLYTLRPDQII
jgi:hypothetical protein